MELKPGRELDALIAERVMGLDLKELKPFGIGHSPGGHWAPRYSTDIAAAWEVVEKVRGFSRLYDFDIYFYGDDEFTATFVTDKTYRAHSMESAPHAICLAAIKALNVL